MRKLTLIALVISAIFMVSGSAFADWEVMEPSSLLIFPFFSSEVGKDTLITVTNVNINPRYSTATGGQVGSIRIHYFYVDGEDCDVTDRREALTPGDTLTVLASEHNPAMNAGWLYVLTENALNEPCEFDGTEDGFDTGILGDAIVANGIANALWAIPAIGVEAEQADFKKPTDTNPENGFADLNGQEYDEMPDKLYISSFIEQGFAGVTTELVLLAFVRDNAEDDVDGGANEDVRVDLDFLFYNNDEVEFSQEDDMRCWMVRPLKDIFNGADNLGGVPAVVPTGWASIEVEDGVDTASGYNIDDDEIGILGMIIQRVGGTSYSSARLLHTSNKDDVDASLEHDAN